MNVLAIDTSHGVGSVAAVAPGRVALRMLPVAGEHARLLAGCLVAAAAEAGFTPAEADLVAVVRGPGSFTGLRVGVTTAKALAWASAARLCGVSAAQAIARCAARRIAPAPLPAVLEIVFDAGRGEIHAVTVAADGGDWQPRPGRLVAPGPWLAALPTGAVISGPGLPLVADFLPGRPDILAVPGDEPLAETVAAIALERLRAGLTDDPAALVPDYIRPSYAEESPRPDAR
jgi:tRNA threonylcarbamoyladenosine biosynthesis protein TsaB